MSTVVELRQMAKERGITGISKMVKAELQKALGLPITGAPRAVKTTSPPVASASAPRPVVRCGAKATPAPAPVKVVRPVVQRNKGDLLKLLQIGDNDETIAYIIPFEEIQDFNKLLDQASLPMTEREVVNEELGMDYIEELCQDKAQDTVQADDVYVVQDDQRIVYTMVVISKSE